MSQAGVAHGGDGGGSDEPGAATRSEAGKLRVNFSKTATRPMGEVSDIAIDVRICRGSRKWWRTTDFDIRIAVFGSPQYPVVFCIRPFFFLSTHVLPLSTGSH